MSGPRRAPGPAPEQVRAARRRGRWARIRRFEYWPPWALYLPVVPVLLGRALRRGGVRSATCVNPAIELGGLVGESKSEILSLLGTREEVARWARIEPGGVQARRAEVERFARTLGPRWPIVLKPDRGERGEGVTIARDDHQVDEALRRIRIPVVAQEYVPGPEYGVFWYRRPGAPEGVLFSVAAKEPVVVVGDGRRTLLELMIEHERARPMLDLHLRRHRERLNGVPRRDEPVPLTELGTHCLGATFRDASALATPALRAALDALVPADCGLDFGRFDLRVSSAAALREGRDLKVLEFNGLSSEAAHLYDPDMPLRRALSILARQWTVALEIGHERRRAGARPASWRRILGAWRRHAAERDQRGVSVPKRPTTAPSPPTMGERSGS